MLCRVLNSFYDVLKKHSVLLFQLAIKSIDDLSVMFILHEMPIDAYKSGCRVLGTRFIES